MCRTNFRRRFWLPDVQASVGEQLRFHDLQHGHVAILIAQGVHLMLTVFLGHASITTTLDTYGHLMTGLDEAAADALDALRPYSTDTQPKARSDQHHP